TLDGADSWFANPDSEVSAHYGVGLDGQAHQYVRLRDTAWANGILEAGEQWTALGLGAGNPNHRTVSIETEDKANAGEAVTDLQFTAVLAIAQVAIQQFPTITHLVGHNVISPQNRANCPGARWVTSGRFAALAAQLHLQPVP